MTTAKDLLNKQEEVEKLETRWQAQRVEVTIAERNLHAATTNAETARFHYEEAERELRELKIQVKNED